MIQDRILVTGGNGRLGQTVLQALGERGVAGVRQAGSNGDEIIITSDGDVDAARLSGIGAIINCAGRTNGNSAQMEQANVRYPLKLARHAGKAGVSRFIQVSSFSVFGRAEYIDSRSALAPIDAYGRSKLAAERALIALSDTDFRVVALRLPFMFSADNPALLGRLTSLMLQLKVLPYRAGHPSQRSMITYSSAADALVSCAEKGGRTARTLSAADPVPLGLNDIAQAIGEQFQQKIATLPVPGPITVGLEAILPPIANRLFRSSILDPSENMLKGGVKHSVRDELYRYLEVLRTHNGVS